MSDDRTLLTEVGSMSGAGPSGRTEDQRRVDSMNEFGRLLAASATVDGSEGE